MGFDKEATDIWKFGRPRPDLTPDETLSAAEPELTDAEKRKRHRRLTALARKRSKQQEQWIAGYAAGVEAEKQRRFST